MGHPQEQEWQLALHKAKHSVRHQQKTPLKERQERLLLDMEQGKYLLTEALHENNASDAAVLLERLIQLRAKQTAFALEQWDTTYGKPSHQIVDLETRRYMEDCADLIDAVEGYFS